MIIDHKCYECGFKGEVIENNRKVTCPQCNTTNDVWLEGERPPDNHIIKVVNGVAQIDFDNQEHVKMWEKWIDD